MDSMDANMISQGAEQSRISAMQRSSRTLAHAAKQGGADKDAKIREAANEFEAVFISQMLTHMFDGVGDDNAFGGGHAEEIYKSMLIDEYGKIMVDAGGIGVADHVVRQLVGQQERATTNLKMVQSAYAKAQETQESK